VGQFLGADVRQYALAAAGRHGVALGEVAHCGAQFAIRTAELPVLYNRVIVYSHRSRRNMTPYR
jgi:hypothetical protein